MNKQDVLSTPLREVIFTRRSVRKFKPEPVPSSVVERMLDAAIWAPSAHNRQPWRFVVIQTAERITGLAQAMGARLRRDLVADGVPEAAIQADTEKSFRRITSAPLLVVLCLSMVDMDVYADAERQQLEFLMAVQSAALAGENLLLSAHDQGLGACWMCAPLFCPDVVRATLDLPEDWQPQALLAIGYPDEAPQKTRRPLEASVLWR